MIPQSRVLSRLALHSTPKKSSVEEANMVPKSRVLSKGLQEAGPEGGARHAVRQMGMRQGVGDGGAAVPASIDVRKGKLTSVEPDTSLSPLTRGLVSRTEASF